MEETIDCEEDESLVGMTCNGSGCDGGSRLCVLLVLGLALSIGGQVGRTVGWLINGSVDTDEVCGGKREPTNCHSVFPCPMSSPVRDGVLLV